MKQGRKKGNRRSERQFIFMLHMCQDTRLLALKNKDLECVVVCIIASPREEPSSKQAVSEILRKESKRKGA